jgi:hypothetical protein
MIIIGADYHPSFQQIAFVDTETGELQERRLEHPEAAEALPICLNLRYPSAGWLHSRYDHRTGAVVRLPQA